jgi:putative ABC transport system ATP-binding protein
MNTQFGTTVVIITHNEAIAGMADQVVRLKDGKIVENQNNDDKCPAAELAL